MIPDDFSDAAMDPEARAVAELLATTHPVPAPGFRDQLARQLADDDLGWGPRPEHLWPQATALIIVGVILLLVGALISTGGM